MVGEEGLGQGGTRCLERGLPHSALWEVRAPAVAAASRGSIQGHGGQVFGVRAQGPSQQPRMKVGLAPGERRRRLRGENCRKLPKNLPNHVRDEQEFAGRRGGTRGAGTPRGGDTCCWCGGTQGWGQSAMGTPHVGNTLALGTPNVGDT